MDIVNTIKAHGLACSKQVHGQSRDKTQSSRRERQREHYRHIWEVEIGKSCTYGKKSGIDKRYMACKVEGNKIKANNSGRWKGPLLNTNSRVE